LQFRPPEFQSTRLGLVKMERKRVLRPPQPTIVVDLFPEVLNELLWLLSSLPSEDWRKPTVCPGWSVKDVALHLLGVEVGNLSRRRDGHTLGASPAGWEEVVAFVNDWNQGWVQVARRISSRLLIDLLQFTGVQVCDYFRSLDPHVMGGPVSWVGPGPAPVWLDLAREYTERWHHQQHIRDAAGKPGLKQPRYFAPVLATFVWALPHAFRATSAAEDTSVTLRITGGSGGQWSLLQERGEWRLYQGAAGQPDAEVILDGDIAWRLFTRGLCQNVARQHMTFTGDRALGLRVLEMVSIIA
jgi:uncharacterized protein (TIGR03083 family)